MPLTISKMRTDEARKIKKNLVALKKDMDAKDLIDFFIQEEIFDLEDDDFIKGFNPNTTATRNEAFFKLLNNSGPKAYGVFLKALEKNGQPHLAKLIEETVLGGGEGDLGEEAGWITSISESVRTRRLEDRDLSKLPQTLGSGWELVMFDLDLKKVDVENAKQEQQKPDMQIFSCLNKWKNQKVNEATLEKFVNACKDSQKTTVLWAKLKSIAQEMK